MVLKRLDEINKGYHFRQKLRIEGLRKRIVAREQTLQPGRLIPVPSDLSIGRGRRLDAAVLFLDICGFSHRPADTAEEQDLMIRLLSFFFAEMVRIVDDYGGMVEKNTGDGLMVYFSKHLNWQEDVRQRATAAALTMMHANENFIRPVVVASGAEPIEFRVCIDYGPITVARLGVAKSFNHIVAIGATANWTSKMLQYAGPAEILLGSNMPSGLPDAWRSQNLEFVMPDPKRSTDTMQYGIWRFTGRWRNPEQ